MPPRLVRDAKLLNHFTIMIYPFYYDRSVFSHSVDGSISAKWPHWLRRLSHSELIDAVDSTFFLLPSIRSLLFPEFDNQDAVKTTVRDRIAGSMENIQKFGLSDAAFKSYVQHSSAVLHLTLGQLQLESIQTIRVRSEDGQFDTNMNVAWVDLFLCPQSVGILAVKMSIDSQTPALSELLKVNHYLRSILPPFAGWRAAQLVPVGRQDVTSAQELVSFLVGDLMAGGYSNYVQSPAGQALGEKFNVYSYATVKATDIDDTLAIDESSRRSRNNALIYEFATSAILGSSTEEDGDYRPSQRRLDALVEEHYIELWHGWSGACLNDSTVFLGFSGSDFNTRVLAANVELDYFWLMVLTLYQKIQLYRYLDNFAIYRFDQNQGISPTRAVLDTFVEYRSRYWFPEVSPKPQGNLIYRRMQVGFGTRELFDRIDDELSRLAEHYERKVGRRVRYLFDLIAFVVTPMVLLASVFGAKMFTLDWREIHPNWLALLLVLAVVFLSYLLVILGYYAWEELREKRLHTK